MEYHPNSGRETKVYPFHEFVRGRDELPPPPADKAPWWPFRSRTEFEFAEFALKASLSNQEVDDLLALFRRILSGKDSFTFTRHTDIQQAWTDAYNVATPVCAQFIFFLVSNAC